LSKSDDSSLSGEQLAIVKRHADRLLREAASYGRFPTPVSDLMAAAKLIVVEDEFLDANYLSRAMRKAKAGIATLKSALSKVWGLFDSRERIVVIDRVVPNPKRPFVKLHEAGHGYMPHQSKLYLLMHDCERTLDPDTTDLFEREANVFASEVMFQGDTFAKEARESEFSQRAAIRLAKKYGASNYSTFRKYVTTRHEACCLVVLNPPFRDECDQVSAEVRRVIASKSFALEFEPSALLSNIAPMHPLASAVPVPFSRRMVNPHDVWLLDRNGVARLVTIESFNTTHQILVLMRDKGIAKEPRVFVPGRASRKIARFSRSARS
jgi:Zn-dependent peptidase ImmA (M78 family)